jgi:hypothetical protein
MGDDDGAAVLAMSDEWVIDVMARERMAQQLDRAPAHVSGIVAEIGDLPAGASYRVHAERLALQPPSATEAMSARRARGAVVVRSGVAFDVQGDLVEVERGSLVLDHGAHAHDPWRALAPLGPATRLGRPPFPWRPVVLLVACDDDLDLADRARTLTNALLRLDVEARLALPEAAEGLNLTQPCLPSGESVRALACDVIVALDETALAHAPEWCGGDRSAVVVEVVLGLDGKVDLVSWQLGKASGRLRARVDERVRPRDLVGLVKRLCAGPHPAAPVDDGVAPRDAETEVLLPELKLRPRPVRRSLVVVTGVLDAGSRARLDGLVDHIPAAGGRVEVVPIAELSPAATSADVALLVSLSGSEAARELVETRRRDNRASVVDLAPSDLLEADGPGAPPTLTPAAAQLVTTCGLATTPSAAVRASVRELGVRALLLPTVLTRTRLAALKQARDRWPDPDEQPEQEAQAAQGDELRVVGWHVAAGPPDAFDAVIQAVRSIATDRPELRVELTGDPRLLPASLLDEWWVSATPGDPEPQMLARWAVQLWIASRAQYETAGDLRPLIEAGMAGVPTVLAVADHAGHNDPVLHELLVERSAEAGQWIAQLQPLIENEDEQAELAGLVIRRSEALFGAATSGAVVNRFLGWALYRAATA